MFALFKATNTSYSFRHKQVIWVHPPTFCSNKNNISVPSLLTIYIRNIITRLIKAN